jgi:HAD superfamily 5'-nucleotidase-like hydrolase
MVEGAADVGLQVRFAQSAAVEDFCCGTASRNGGARLQGGSEETEEPPFYSPDAEMWPMDYFGESTRGDLLPRMDLVESGRELSPEELVRIQGELRLDHWGTPLAWELPAEPQRSVFCSRTLNMRSLRCIGYDMDYTLIHYKVIEWEGRAYHYAKQNLNQVGFPIEDLQFNPDLVCRGLIIDKTLGNMVKVDRFGYVRRAMHGTRRLSHRETHEIYGRQLVDLREKRWLFLNTLFSVSEGCLYAQLVEKFDAGDLAELQRKMTISYDSLFNAVSKALFKAHVEGRLKADVMNNPDRYVENDADLPKTLLDQRLAGKKLALITNSDWEYTKVMMAHVIDRFLPEGKSWRDIFDVTIVSARKPAFFSQSMPLYEIVTEDGMLREKFKLKEGRVYSGGSASMVEALFQCDADDIMYIGDHIFTDVNLAKAYMRWRTALIVREIEEEVVAMDRGRQHTLELHTLIKQKEKCGNILNHMRTELHRYERDGFSDIFTSENEARMKERMGDLLSTMVQYDNHIAPMLYQEGSNFNAYWGYISRGGFGDKSHLMRQIEKYADVYTSRVSNFLRSVPLFPRTHLFALLDA